MTHRRLLPLLACVLLVTTGCNEQTKQFSVATSELVQAPEAARQRQLSTRQVKLTSVPSSAARPDRKLVKSGTLRFSVEDYADARATIERRIEQFGGYISSEDVSRRPGRIRNRLTARVPAGRFEPLMDTLAAVALQVDERKVDVKEVTRKFVDLQARLRTHRAAEERYLALLDRANSVEDVLAVVEELRQVRTEIERIQGQFNYLKNRIALSTITLIFYQNKDLPAEVAAPGFFSRVGSAFVDGWTDLLNVFASFVNIWPLLLLMGTIGWLAVRSYQRRRSTSASENPAASPPPSTS